MSIVSYQDLDIWKKAIDTAEFIYRVTTEFPKSEQYGLAQQMRRAAVSLGSNIAEGYRRQYDTELRQFLYIVLGSAAELETQSILSKKLGYMTEASCSELIERLDHLSRMVSNFIKRLHVK